MSPQSSAHGDVSAAACAPQIPDFRDPGKARELIGVLERLCAEIGRDVSIVHVCGSHEQAIARFGLREVLPSSLDVVMGPGCPVCVTDEPEVDEAVAVARAGHVVATYGDMLRVPGSIGSLAQAKAEGADVRVVYSAIDAASLAGNMPRQEVVFFASGFETTAVATAAVVLSDPPENFTVLSAHKYIPPAMEIVAEMPGTAVEGFLAAGNAATITGWKIFERFAERHRRPVVVGGFEPLDILAALVCLLELIRDDDPRVHNAYPRCCSAEGNRAAQEILWRVFRPVGGTWRGIANIPNANLRLRDEFSAVDARRRHRADLSSYESGTSSGLAQRCMCGNIMAAAARPDDCPLFATACTPEQPVGACMVSSEGACRISYQYGGLRVVAG